MSTKEPLHQEQSNLQSCHDLVTDRLSFTINVSFPPSAPRSNSDAWSMALTGLDGWKKADFDVVDASSLHALQNMESHEKIFIHAFLRLSQVFFTLIRLPVFDLPVIQKLSKTDSRLGRYQLEISVPAIRDIALPVYEKTLSVALDVCVWIMKYPATLPNKKYVFDTVEQKLIKPLMPFVPAGQSTIPTLRAAHELGIPFLHIGLGIYQLGWGSRAVLLDRSTTLRDSAIGLRLTQSKVSTANVLKMAGLPAPVHISVSTVQQASKAAEQIGYPVVVKPIDQERGEGVTVDIRDNEALSTAFFSACDKTPSRQVLVERQVAGVCHRIFIVGKQLLYAVKRLPISVQGDGVKSIEQLVVDHAEAQTLIAPWLRKEAQSLDDLARATLAKANLTESSVPLPGTWVPLRPTESTAWGGVDQDVTIHIHPENIAAALTAAALFGLHTAGVDMISADISKPWHENGAVINEVNFAPLLGGAEISRSYLPAFFAQIMHGDGRIPIEYVDHLDAAKKRQESFKIKGLRCFVTTPYQTFDAVGNLLALPFDGLKKRCMALIYRSEVDAIVLVP
jgi:cyanophycin synthetase